MHTAKLKIGLKDPKSAYESLKPEIEETSRFKVQLKAHSSYIELNVKAKDITALRASLNTYLRLLRLIDSLDKPTKV